MADRVDEELNEYRERHSIAGPWETKERVVVSLTGSRGSAVLIRRAARMAMRTKAELVGVHVRTDDSLTGSGSKGLVENRALLDDLGGRFVEVVGSEVAPALVQVARAENATQLVMGATHRSRLNEFVRGSVINAVIRAAGGSLDVHVIATGRERESDADGSAADQPGDDGKQPGAGPVGPHRGLFSPLSRRRRVAALAIGVIGFPLLTLMLTADRSIDSLATALSTYLVLVVAVAAVGGVWPAALAVIAGFLLSNYYFAPPIHTFTIADARDILALVMFLVTAGVVSLLVDMSARRTAAAIEARTDAHTLARIAGRMVAPEGNPLPALLQELVLAFRLDGAAVLRSATAKMPSGTVSGTAESSPGSWSQVAAAGETPPLEPGQASMVLPLTDRELLALRGPGLPAEDQEILSAFAAQLAAALASDRLHSEAAEAETLAKANQLAVGPVGGGEPRPADPPGIDKGGVLEPAVRSARLRPRGDPDPAHHGRQRGGPAQQPGREPIGHEPDPDRVDGRAPPECRHRRTDRVRSAQLGAAGREDGRRCARPAPPHPHRPGPARAGGGQSGGQRSDPRRWHRSPHRSGGGGRPGRHPGHRPRPGHRPEDRDRIFQPFQRLGDSASRGGVGLGLAVARGFVEAVGGDLDVEDTPGGGLTMVVRLPRRGIGRTGPFGADDDQLGGDGRFGPVRRNDRMTSAPPTSASGPAGGAEAGEAGATILVCDDDASYAEGPVH